MRAGKLICRFNAIRCRRQKIQISDSQYYLDVQKGESLEDFQDRHILGILDQMERIIWSLSPDEIEFMVPEFKISRRMNFWGRESRRRFAFRARKIAEPILAYWIDRITNPKNQPLLA